FLCENSAFSAVKSFSTDLNRRGRRKRPQRTRRTPRAARIGRANALRTALSGVPQELGQRSQEHLRRVLLSSRSFLRLRLGSQFQRLHARKDLRRPAQHLALFSPPPPPPRSSTNFARGFYTAHQRAEFGEEDRRKEFVRQERCGMSADVEL